MNYTAYTPALERYKVTKRVLPYTHNDSLWGRMAVCVAGKLGRKGTGERTYEPRTMVGDSFNHQ